MVSLPHLNHFFIKLVFYKEAVLNLLTQGSNHCPFPLEEGQPQMKKKPTSLPRPATNEKTNISPKASCTQKNQHPSHTTLHQA